MRSYLQLETGIMDTIYDRMGALFLLRITMSLECALSPCQTFSNQSEYLEPMRMPALSKRLHLRAYGRAQRKNLKRRALLMLLL